MVEKHYLKATKKDSFTSKVDGKKSKVEFDEISWEDADKLGKYYEKENEKLNTKRKKWLNIPTKVELEKLIFRLREAKVKDNLLVGIKNPLNLYESFLKEISRAEFK